MNTGKPMTLYLSNQVMDEIDRRRGIVSRSLIVNSILECALEIDGLGDPEDV